MASDAFGRDSRRYKKKVKDYLSDPKNAFCVLKGNNCTNFADSVDHLQPLSKHPEIDTFDQDNWVPACRACNFSKKDLEWEDWKKKQMDSLDPLQRLMTGLPKPPNPKAHRTDPTTDDWNKFNFR
jgi:5-methylcytosine-specific restriction endonuclease McrA